METTFERIIRKSGRKPVSCKCQLCKSQCAAPCMGTPEDMLKIIEAGYGNRVVIAPVDGLQILSPMYDGQKKACTFFTNGLCELHESGLKPTVGKLSHHSTDLKSFNPKKSIHRFVMDEWRSLTKDKLQLLIDKYVPATVE